jgi:hypothetical protein
MTLFLAGITVPRRRGDGLRGAKFGDMALQSALQKSDGPPLMQKRGPETASVEKICSAIMAERNRPRQESPRVKEGDAHRSHQQLRAGVKPHEPAAA